MTKQKQKINERHKDKKKERDREKKRNPYERARIISRLKFHEYYFINLLSDYTNLERKKKRQIEKRGWSSFDILYTVIMRGNMDGKGRKIYRKRDKRDDIEDENRGKRELE